MQAGQSGKEDLGVSLRWVFVAAQALPILQGGWGELCLEVRKVWLGVRML